MCDFLRDINDNDSLETKFWKYMLNYGYVLECVDLTKDLVGGLYNMLLIVYKIRGLSSNEWDILIEYFKETIVRNEFVLDRVQNDDIEMIHFIYNNLDWYNMLVEEANQDLNRIYQKVNDDLLTNSYLVFNPFDIAYSLTDPDGSRDNWFRYYKNINFLEISEEDNQSIKEFVELINNIPNNQVSRFYFNQLELCDNFSDNINESDIQTPSYLLFLNIMRCLRSKIPYTPTEEQITRKRKRSREDDEEIELIYEPRKIKSTDICTYENPTEFFLNLKLEGNENEDILTIKQFSQIATDLNQSFDKIYNLFDPKYHPLLKIIRNMTFLASGSFNFYTISYGNNIFHQFIKFHSKDDPNMNNIKLFYQWFKGMINNSDETNSRIVKYFNDNIKDKPILRDYIDKNNPFLDYYQLQNIVMDNVKNAGEREEFLNSQEVEYFLRLYKDLFMNAFFSEDIFLPYAKKRFDYLTKIKNFRDKVISKFFKEFKFNDRRIRPESIQGCQICNLIPIPPKTFYFLQENVSNGRYSIDSIDYDNAVSTLWSEIDCNVQGGFIKEYFDLITTNLDEYMEFDEYMRNIIRTYVNTVNSNLDEIRKVIDFGPHVHLTDFNQDIKEQISQNINIIKTSNPNISTIPLVFDYFARNIGQLRCIFHSVYYPTYKHNDISLPGNPLITLPVHGEQKTVDIGYPLEILINKIDVINRPVYQSISSGLLESIFNDISQQSFTDNMVYGKPDFNNIYNELDKYPYISNILYSALNSQKDLYSLNFGKSLKNMNLEETLPQTNYNTNTTNFSYYFSATDENVNEAGDVINISFLDPHNFDKVDSTDFDIVWFGVNRKSTKGRELIVHDNTKLKWTDKLLGPYQLRPYTLVNYRMKSQFFSDYLFTGILLGYDMDNTTHLSLYKYPTHMMIQQLYPVTLPISPSNANNNDTVIVSVPIPHVYPYKYLPLSFMSPSPNTLFFGSYLSQGLKPLFDFIPDKLKTINNIKEEIFSYRGKINNPITYLNDLYKIDQQLSSIYNEINNDNSQRFNSPSSYLEKLFLQNGDDSWVNFILKSIYIYIGYAYIHFVTRRGYPPTSTNVNIPEYNVVLRIIIALFISGCRSEIFLLTNILNNERLINDNINVPSDIYRWFPKNPVQSIFHNSILIDAFKNNDYIIPHIEIDTLEPINLFTSNVLTDNVMMLRQLINMFLPSQLNLSRGNILVTKNVLYNNPELEKNLSSVIRNYNNRTNVMNNRMEELYGFIPIISRMNMNDTVNIEFNFNYTEYNYRLPSVKVYDNGFSLFMLIYRLTFNATNLQSNDSFNSKYITNVFTRNLVKQKYNFLNLSPNSYPFFKDLPLFNRVIERIRIPTISLTNMMAHNFGNDSIYEWTKIISLSLRNGFLISLNLISEYIKKKVIKHFAIVQSNTINYYNNIYSIITLFCLYISNNIPITKVTDPSIGFFNFDTSSNYYLTWVDMMQDMVAGMKKYLGLIREAIGYNQLGLFKMYEKFGSDNSNIFPLVVLPDTLPNQGTGFNNFEMNKEYILSQLNKYIQNSNNEEINNRIRNFISEYSIIDIKPYYKLFNDITSNFMPTVNTDKGYLNRMNNESINIGYLNKNEFMIDENEECLRFSYAGINIDKNNKLVHY